MLRGRMAPRYPWPDPVPDGSYHTVEEVLGPVTLRLSRLGVVRLAGVADPQEPADRQRAATFLRQLLLAGTAVYVELEPRSKREPDAPVPVSIYLPPSDDDRAAPFPYADARLVAGVLVQQGLARVDTERLYRYRAELEFQEDDARRHGRGLWSILHPPL